VLTRQLIIPIFFSTLSPLALNHLGDARGTSGLTLLSEGVLDLFAENKEAAEWVARLLACLHNKFDSSPKVR